MNVLTNELCALKFRKMHTKSEKKDEVSVIYGRIDPYSPWKIIVNSLSSL